MIDYTKTESFRGAQAKVAQADASTIRKRAERLRRKEAGEVRVEVWLDRKTMNALDQIQQISGRAKADIISAAIVDVIRIPL